MNLNASTVIIVLVVILVIPYLISVIGKLQKHNISFADVLNPFYKNTAEMQVAAELKLHLSPIIKEIETQEVAKFITYWTAKFEKGNLSEQDVTDLNAKIEQGNKNQVNGILALHPQGRIMFDEINERMKSKEEALVNAETETGVLA